jgi:hypothetical protein
MWTCPECGKPFKARNDRHSCKIVPVKKHFENRDPAFEEIFEKLIRHISTFGNYYINSLPYCILLKRESTFLAIKIKKDHLLLEFFLEAEENIFPVFKILRTSKNRVVHFVAIENAAELKQQVLDWIKRSYELVGK